MYSKLPILAVLTSLLLGFVGLNPKNLPSEGQTGGTTGLSTTGTSGAGSTSGSSPFAPTAGYAPNSAAEYKASDSYVSNGGSTATLSSHHICRFNLTLPTVSSTASVSYGGTNYSATLNSANSGFIVAIADPNGIGAISGVSSGSYHAGNVVVTGRSGTTPTYSQGISVGVAPGTTVPLDLCATGPLSGSSPAASISLYLEYGFTDSMGTHHTMGSSTYWMFNLNYVKNLCDDASVDTRKQFGQPQVDGHTPGDANGDLRPVNFGSWKYKGGLFVGNVAYLNNDESGVARVQLWVNSGGTVGTYKAGCITLFDMGFPTRPNLSGDFTVGFFAPTTSSSATESTATWANRFNIDTTVTPISTVSLATSNTNDYLNWGLGTALISQIALATPHDEDGTGAGWIWRYFAGKEFAADHTSSTFPLNDCAPRVWAIGESNMTAWYSDVIS